jgi:hypothetical protein
MTDDSYGTVLRAKGIVAGENAWIHFDYIPGEADVYALAGRDGMRSSVMTLNGVDLIASPKGELPELAGVKAEGSVEIAPGSCAFIVV